MNLIEAMENRHAVRKFRSESIEQSVLTELTEEIARCNQESGLSIQLIIQDKNTFRGFLPFFAGFRNVSNYLALVGPKDDLSLEKIGYYGQRIVLKAQQLGLNSCWAGQTFKRTNCQANIKQNETLACVVALGYGKTDGKPHQSKPMSELCSTDQAMPAWFEQGMTAAMLAPTANNKQNFFIELKQDEAIFKTEKGTANHVSLGIVKYQFELGHRGVNKVL
ncbi:nitroreductase [Enterococcus sp. JM4C]|uniref:nitroreductase family protein n=1 Tax=Candidatus Enterococcus huntleyi TaxID=1857217 RepID=UPI00137A22A9|nr:nitroreductase family protein [Enterococcus sp. JM4C]KAF1297537.1 nitroreductase [Enterococcus sp. JM4C]